MSDTSQGTGWWQASDGKWYAPELYPKEWAPSEDAAAAVTDSGAPEVAGAADTAEVADVESDATQAISGIADDLTVAAPDPAIPEAPVPEAPDPVVDVPEVDVPEVAAAEVAVPEVAVPEVDVAEVSAIVDDAAPVVESSPMERPTGWAVDVGSADATIAAPAFDATIVQPAVVVPEPPAPPAWEPPTPDAPAPAPPGAWQAPAAPAAPEGAWTAPAPAAAVPPAPAPAPPGAWEAPAAPAAPEGAWTAPAAAAPVAPDVRGATQGLSAGPDIPGGLLGLLGAGLLIVGSLLAWAEARGIGVSGSVNALSDSNGWGTLVAGLIAAAMGGLLLAGQREKWIGPVLALAGVVGLGLAVFSMLDINSKSDSLRDEFIAKGHSLEVADSAGLDLSLGIWLAIGGGAVALIAGIVSAVRSG